MDRIVNQQTFNAGIAESEKEGLTGSSYFSKHINIYQDPRYIELFPAPIKVSDTVITDLIKWIVPATGYDNNIYLYGDTGRVYRKDQSDNCFFINTMTLSVGNGMEVYNDYLYMTTSANVVKYGPLSSGSPTMNFTWQTGLSDTQYSKFAPIKAFKEGFALGHQNNLAWYDGIIWEPSKILLPPGFNIRTLEVFNEYLVIGAWKGTDVTDNDEGYMFFWDGISDTFNFFVTAQNGGVLALLNTKNYLLSFLGSDGTFYRDYAPFSKLQQLPKMTLSDYTDIFPGAVTNWRSLSLYGVAGNSDATDLVRGVYAYGSTSSKYADSLCFAFSISTGNTGDTVQIASVKGVGTELYIGWKDGDSYGLDKVVNTNPCYSSGYFEQLIFDNQTLYREKRINRIKATHYPLEEGQGIQVSTSLDRKTYLNGVTNTTGDTNQTNFTPPLNRAREIQNKVTLTSTTGISPRVTSLAMLFDDQRSEGQF